MERQFTENTEVTQRSRRREICLRASRALLPIRFSVPSVLPPSPLWTAFSPFASYTPIVTSTHAKIWTTRALLTWMGDAFTKKGLDSPRLMGEC